MKRLLLIPLVLSVPTAAWFSMQCLLEEHAFACYFDPDDTTQETSGQFCDSGRPGYGEVGGCEKASYTLTIKSHSGYLTHWTIDVSPVTGGIWGYWFGTGSSNAEYAFSLNGTQSTVTHNVTVNIQTNGGTEQAYINLRHDEENDDVFEDTDALFDYFEFNMT